MRIEELSIGDWVTYDKCSDPVQILSVDSRNGKCVVMTDSCYPNGVIGFIDNVHPIPLTPEILEKNGVHFVENFEDDEYLFACPMFSVIWLKGRGEWKFCVPNAWLYIRSVHELQHALRLAGIEKEIVV